MLGRGGVRLISVHHHIQCVFKDTITIKKNHIMKTEIFKRYAENVCSLLDMSMEELFSKNKATKYSEARQLLCYACSIRPMSLITIQKAFESYGYTMGHSNVIYNIGRAKKKIAEDADYAMVIKKITKG